jgi:hypothetical protein
VGERLWRHQGIHKGPVDLDCPLTRGARRRACRGGIAGLPLHVANRFELAGNSAVIDGCTPTYARGGRRATGLTPATPRANIPLVRLSSPTVRARHRQATPANLNPRQLRPPILAPRSYRPPPNLDPPTTVHGGSPAVEQVELVRPVLEARKVEDSVVALSRRAGWTYYFNLVKSWPVDRRAVRCG